MGIKLFHGDCLPILKEMPEESVDCMITSPPYVGAPRFWGAWFHSSNAHHVNQWLREVWDECLRVLRPGCKMIINVANTKRRPYVSNVHELYRWAEIHSVDPRVIILDEERNAIIARVQDGRLNDKDFRRLEKIHGELAPLLYKVEPLGEIIWDKGYGQSGTAWGSFRSPSDIALADAHEYIVIFRKFGQRNRPEEFEKINTFDFKSWRNSLWRIAPEKASKVNHVAPFPVAIPCRLITLYTFEGETVLDPFMGRGTTGIAADRLGRSFVGIEQNEEYFKLAQENLDKEQLQIRMKI